MKNDFSKLRIPKPKREVKYLDATEKKVREAQEKYREMLKEAKDPEYRPEKKYQISLRIPRKYWANELENLNIYERGVLCTYASYMNKERIAWPSLRTIAKILKINTRTVKKSYTGLLKKEVIKYIGKKGRAFIVKIL